MYLAFVSVVGSDGDGKKARREMPRQASFVVADGASLDAGAWPTGFSSSDDSGNTALQRAPLFNDRTNSPARGIARNAAARQNRGLGVAGPEPGSRSEVGVLPAKDLAIMGTLLLATLQC